MKFSRFCVASTLLLSAVAAQADDVWRDSKYGCVIGGGVAGTSSAYATYSLMASGAGTLPVTAIIVGNTVFGCGLGTIGVMLYHGVGSVYSGIFGSSQSQ